MIYSVFGILAVLEVLLFLIILYCKNPFQPTSKVIKIDISGKKKVSMDNLIDEYLCENHDSIYRICDSACDDFKRDCEKKLDRILLFHSHRKKQYDKSLKKMCSKDYPYFVFSFYRNITKYHQRNYVKTSYVEPIEAERLDITIGEMLDILAELESINYATTREKYHSMNQRKLMTKELRQQIKERDHYTCQICGKVMLDEVGLHIDHIIPIKQGGKSVPENLQVLCDKCNLAKGTK